MHRRSTPLTGPASSRAWSARRLPKSSRVPPPAAGGPGSGLNRSNRDSKRVSAPSDPLSRSSRSVRKSESQRRFWYTVSGTPSCPASSTVWRAELASGRERLVARDRQAKAQRLLGERDVGGGRRGDRHRFGSRPGKLLQGGERRAAEIGGDLAAALGRGGDHPEELAGRGGGDQRRVKVPGRQGHSRPVRCEQVQARQDSSPRVTG